MLSTQIVTESPKISVGCFDILKSMSKLLVNGVGLRIGMKKHIYFVVAKFSSSSTVSSEDAEQYITEAIKRLGADVKPEIVQMGEL